VPPELGSARPVPHHGWMHSLSGLLTKRVGGAYRLSNAGSRGLLEKAGSEVMHFIPEMDRFLYRRHRQELKVAANAG
jgi:hypothetical protein